MTKKVFTILILVVFVFTFVGCQSNFKKVISDFESFGYYVELDNNEREESMELFQDVIVNIYQVYDSNDTYVADLIEMESEEALFELVVEQGFETDHFPHRENMLLVPIIQDTFRLVLVFYGHDPEDF